MKITYYFLQFIFIRFLFLLMIILPLNLSKNFSSFILRTIGKLTSAHNTAIKNCKLVFPELDDLKIKSIINESWDNIGINICELLNFKKIIKNNSIVLNGLSNIENLKKNDQQAIFVSIHQSNWEFLVPMLDRLDLRIGGIYRHINNYFLDKLILNIRRNTLRSNKNFYTPKGKQSARDLVEALNNNFSIVLLVDQKDSAGEEILFFNKKVKTQTGFLKIARKFNLPIVPIRNTRLKNGKVELNFLEPIFHNDKNVSDSKMMEKIHKLAESWIVSNPKQWFWQHKRFN